MGSDIDIVVIKSVRFTISIHAPRMGSDRPHAGERVHALHISIHAPRMGSDARWPSNTPCVTNFNPRSPDGERRARPFRRHRRQVEFQSTLPGWGATIGRVIVLICGEISIHAPRMGSDAATFAADQSTTHYFNPRSPDGERPIRAVNPVSQTTFQSTLPGWGATSAILPSILVVSKFQSTLPGWGATDAW